MELLYKIIRLFLQNNKGFLPFEVREQIKKDRNIGKSHYSDLGGELDAKFGGFSIVKPDGNWEAEAKKLLFEPQRRRVETMYCTIFDTENLIQMVQVAKYGEYEEYDEIPLAHDAGVSPYRGGSPHSVMETIRKGGMYPKGTYPFDDSITTKEQLLYKPTTADRAEAKKWLDRWSFGHEWIWNFSPNHLMEMLKTSPLGVGVYAWNYDSTKKVYTKPSWATDNHWTCVIVGAVPGKYWLVLDSYEDFSGTPFKKLDWNYPFGFVKRIYLEKKTLSEQEQRKKGEDLFNRLQGKHIIRSQTNGEVYEVLKDSIKFCFWSTDCEWLQDKLNRSLREEQKKGTFVGISEADFANLKVYTAFAGIPVEKPEIK